MFGQNWLEWDPAVLRVELEHVVGGPASDHNVEKLQACRLSHVTHHPWHEWQVFEKVVHALNNNLPEFRVVQGCSVGQMWVTLDILRELHPDDQFEDEVKRYMAACMLHAGVTFCPGPLKTVQELVAKPRYKCTKCGYTGCAVGDWSGHCESCSGEHDGEHMAKRELSRRAAHVEVSLTYDPAPVRTRWNEVEGLETNTYPLGDDVVDIQVTKLVVARDYARLRQTQKEAQLKWLTNSSS